MENIKIDETKVSPSIDLNYSTGIFEISGKSMPENIIAFYKPVIEWFQQYADAPIPNAVLKLKLSYFNTSSSKAIFEIVKILDKINIEKELNQVIELYYMSYDDDVKELGEYYQDLLKSNCIKLIEI